MHNTPFKDTLWGFFFTAAAGTLLHFAYNTTPLPAFLVPVNESIWEHLKLLYWPTVFYTFWTMTGSSWDTHLLWARCCGLITGLLATIILYYTYTGVIGRGFLMVDIALFYFSAAAAYALSYALYTRFPAPERWELLLFGGLVLLIGLTMITWSANPPRIQLFRDPATGNYGIAPQVLK